MNQLDIFSADHDVSLQKPLRCGGLWMPKFGFNSSNGFTPLSNCEMSHLTTFARAENCLKSGQQGRHQKKRAANKQSYIVLFLFEFADVCFSSSLFLPVNPFLVDLPLFSQMSF